MAKPSRTKTILEVYKKNPKEKEFTAMQMAKILDEEYCIPSGKSTPNMGYSTNTSSELRRLTVMGILIRRRISDGKDGTPEYAYRLR